MYVREPMAKVDSANTYEEARKQRVLENMKRFQDLGIQKISKSLTDLTKSEKKTKERRVKPRTSEAYMVEPRRSSRSRNPVTSYRDDIDVELPRFRKRSNFSSSWASYLARPLEEVKSASHEERAYALKSAEKLQSNLQSGNPSFIKSMVRSHVYSCFWLGLPTWFCESHLPKSTVDMVLEDEQCAEYEAVYISKRTGLSGGWRGFALDHKLDDGDALVFELIQPTRFKVYIIRVSDCSIKDKNLSASEIDADAVRASKCSSEDKNLSTSEIDDDTEETAIAVKRRKNSSHSQFNGSMKSKKGNPSRASARKKRTQGK